MPDISKMFSAPKLHNVRAILSDWREHGDAVYDRFKGGKDGTLWYYRALAEVFTRLGPCKLAIDLDHVLVELT